MAMERLARLRQTLERLFPERHLYVRSGGEIRGFVLTTSKQAVACAAASVAALWVGVASAAMLVNTLSLSAGDQEALRTKAYYERLIADRQARLSTAVAQLNENSGSIDDLANTVEKRHRALALLLAPLRGAPGASVAIAPLKAPTGESPMDRVRFVRMDQERLIARPRPSPRPAPTGSAWR